MSSLALAGVESRPAFPRTGFLAKPDGSSCGDCSRSRFDRSDELQLGDGADLTRISARVRTNTQLRVGEDGSVQLKSRSHLRYSYEFQAADGSKIAIKARANLSYSTSLDEDGNVQIRAKAKLQVSLLQESVNSEAAQFAGNADDLLAGLSDALASFNDVVNQATADFLNAEGLNGDGLITDLVGAFNGLVESLGTPLRIAGPVTNAQESADELPTESTPVLPSEQSVTNLMIEPIDIPTAVDMNAPTEVVAETPLPEITVDDVPADATDLTQPTASDESEVAPAEEPAPLTQPVDVQSLRLKLRVRFTESLSQLVKVFNDGDESQTQTLTRYRQDFAANIRLSARLNAADVSVSNIPAFDFSA